MQRQTLSVAPVQAHGMSATILENQPHLRIVCRKSARSRADFTVPTVRPSLMDLRLRGDYTVTTLPSGSLGICFADHILATLAATPFDLVSLGQRLSQLRHRYPRRRIRR